MFILLFVANLPTNTVGTVVDEYDNDDNDDDNDIDDNDVVVVVIADRRNRCNDMEFVTGNAKENVFVVFVDENVSSKSKVIRIIR